MTPSRVREALLLTLVLSTQTAVPGQQVFRTGTDVVLVDVYPQRDGRIVEGLTAEHFQVFEDGVPQRIDSFEFVRLPGGFDAAARFDPNSLDEMREQVADPHGRVFAVYLDRGQTTIEGANRIRGPLVETLDRVMGPRDLFGVMVPGMRPVDVTFGRLTSTIEHQLATYWTWGQRNRATSDLSDAAEQELTACFETRHVPSAPPNQHAVADLEEWLVDDGGQPRRLDRILIDRLREELAFRSLEELVTHLGRMREARSVVLTVSDGWALFERAPHLEAQPPRDARFHGAFPAPGDRQISTPGSPLTSGQTRSEPDRQFMACVETLQRLASFDGDRRLRDLIQLANRANVSFYPVASEGLAAPNLAGTAFDNVGTRIASLRTIAESTDGIAIVSTNDLAGGMRRIVEDVSAYYLLTYVSSNGRRDGAFRRIEVRVDAPDVTVRARRGYMAAAAAVVDEGSTPAPPPVPAGIVDALERLTRLRSTATVFAHGAVAGDLVHVAVELGPDVRLPGDVGDLPVTAAATARDGSEVGRGRATLDRDRGAAALSFPVPQSAGPWQVTVTVGTGIDRLQAQVVVFRPGTGGVLGEPRLFRARPSLRAPLQPAATSQFSRLERIHVEWPILGRLDARQVRLLDARGQILPATITVEDRAEPIPAVVADLVLGALAPGDYVIEVLATGEDGPTSHYEAVRVTQ